ncbi:MAG: thioether cross-link-forming SCIFF peptide maturase [Oscillospiraceae bacterium]|nr:thioether cross-link-forming SCIFF peptide maturase [Oscillospiraceae bacterium]
MIHKYKLGGLNIVLDANSGGVHLVDELTYDMLDNVKPPFEDKCPKRVVEKLSRFYVEKDIESCYEEVKELYNDGVLFSEDDYAQFAKYSVAAPVKAMCLLVEQDCNLRCEYCFAGTGDYGTGKRMHMDFKTGKKAMDFLLENSGDRENLELDFFGGEPLMNWDVVNQLVKYGRSREKEFGKRFRFTITTNGMLLDEEKMDFINKEMSNVVMSVDGRKEVNDRVRKRVDGTGCYDRIMDKYKTLAKKRNYENYYVRGTFTKYNLDFAEDVLHLYQQGFDQISVEPVTSEASASYALTERELPAIFSEYERLAEIILEHDKQGKHFNFFHFMLDLDQGPCAIKRLRGCGSGNEYVAVTPDGDIYPCHQFVGYDEYKMGNLFDGTFSREMKNSFAAAHIYSKEECTKCWARFYCSGGCNANNYIYTGNILTAHKLSCEIQKKRLECAIMIKAAKFARENEQSGINVQAE